MAKSGQPTQKLAYTVVLKRTQRILKDGIIYLCWSTHSEDEKKPYKQFLLEKCNVHGDSWANEIRLCIESTERLYEPFLQQKES